MIPRHLVTAPCMKDRDKNKETKKSKKTRIIVIKSEETEIM